jgi:membrane dipeptidase
MFIFDAHLDLAMNAVEWNRDLTRPLATIRESDARVKDRPDRGNGTVCLPEMRRGGVGLCVATQIARVEHNAWSPISGWRSPAQAWSMTQAQLAWYREMEAAGELVQIRDRAGLEAHLAKWNPAPSGSTVTTGPVGYILSLEGADSLATMGHLERAYGYGLRAIGPAHYGPGIYANGTHSSGGLNARGRELLAEMRRLGMILDATHLCDDAFWDAMKIWDGPVWGSHQNCRSLVPDTRQWTDDQIREVIRRDGVLGAVFDGWMMVPDWKRGTSTPANTGLVLERILDHIDHICQLAGNARHVGIGSDLDGGFGLEQTPQDLTTIAELQRLPAMLRARGYSEEDVTGFAHGNFLRVLRTAWK